MTLDTCFREEENDFSYVWWKKQPNPTVKPKGHSSEPGPAGEQVQAQVWGHLRLDTSLCLQNPVEISDGAARPSLPSLDISGLRRHEPSLWQSLAFPGR